MSRYFTTAPDRASLADIKRILEGAPEWIVFRSEAGGLATVNETELDRVIAGLESDEASELVEFNPEHARHCVAVRTHATLREALDAMNQNNADVAVVTGSSNRDAGSVQGILTRAQIHAAVRYGG